jgi:hypothetical protein
MTTPRKRTTAEVWRDLEDATNDANLARLDAQPKEELDRALREGGIDPDDAADVGMDLLANGPAERLGAPVTLRSVPPAEKPKSKMPVSVRTMTWLALAAGVALAIGVLTPRPDVVSTGRPSTPRERAAMMREDAYGACAHGRWVACDALLNAARELDPAGDEDPRVLAARTSVSSALHGEGGAGEAPMR